jgi:molybdate transport system regulatory protein
VKPKLKAWVVFGDRVKLGDGRAQLLERINELGSIKKAVAEFGMSYRSAWGYLQELEKAAGFKLLVRTPGGGRLGGTRLTKAGRQFLDRYWHFSQGASQSVKRQFTRSFEEK